MEFNPYTCLQLLHFLQRAWVQQLGWAARMVHDVGTCFVTVHVALYIFYRHFSNVIAVWHGLLSVGTVLYLLQAVCTVLRFCSSAVVAGCTDCSVDLFQSLCHVFSCSCELARVNLLSLTCWAWTCSSELAEFNLLSLNLLKWTCWTLNLLSLNFLKSETCHFSF